MRKWIPPLLILVAFLFSALVYSHLPDPMPVHWNARGEVDRYGSRFWGAFGLPLVMLGIWGLLLAIPHIDPRRANIEKFRESYELLIVAVVGVEALTHVALVGTALGWPVSMGRLVPAVVGILFIFLGNLLPRFRSNWFMGIRTPWTLSSDTVWMKTHRFGGYVMVGVGLLLIIAAIANTESWVRIAVGGSIAMAVSVVAYSFVVWRNEQKDR